MEDCVKTLTLCGVCRDTMKNPQILLCLHSFCQGCIQRVSRNQSVVCPYCKTTTRDVDVKNDFKSRQLIEAQSTSTSSGTYTAVEQAMYHRKELALIKAGFQKEMDAIVQDNKEFSQVVLSKMRATKRVWDEAFDTEIQQAETFLKTQMDGDSRVQFRKRVIQELDVKIKNVTSSRHSSNPASVDKAFRHTRGVFYYDSPTGEVKTNATHIWREWDVVSLKPDVAKTVALLLNPCSAKFLKSNRSTFRKCDMPHNMHARFKHMQSRGEYYRPFIDGQLRGQFFVEFSESSDDEQ